MGKKSKQDSAEITARMDSIITRLDVIINLLLDILPDERFDETRKYTYKVGRLDGTGIMLRPTEVGRIFGRPAKDISSRRREIQQAKLKKAKRIGRAASKPSSAPNHFKPTK